MNSGRSGVVIVILVVIGGFIVLGLIGSMLAVRSAKAERSHRVAIREARVAEADAIATRQSESRGATQLEAPVGVSPAAPGGLLNYRVLRDPESESVVVVDPRGDWILFGSSPVACGFGVPLPRVLEGGVWEVAYASRDRVRLDPKVGNELLVLRADPASSRITTSTAVVPKHITVTMILASDSLRALLALPEDD